MPTSPRPEKESRETAGAERRRDKARADPDLVGRERGLISLGLVGVELWRATIIIPLFPPTSCHRGGGDARAISEGMIRLKV